MRRRVAMLFERCRREPVSNIAKLSRDMTLDEQEKVVALLNTCGDEVKASILTQQRERTAQKHLVVAKRPSLDQLLEIVLNQPSVKDMLERKKAFDEEILIGNAKPDLIERAFYAFKAQRLKCSNKHRERFVEILDSRGEWTTALDVIAATPNPSGKEVELVLKCLQGQWQVALDFAVRNILTSKGVSLAARAASTAGWEFSLRVLKFGAPLSPRDGFDVQQSLLLSGCSWEACLCMIGRMTSLGRNNMLLAVSHLVRHFRFEHAISLVQLLSPISSEWTGFLVKQAEQSGKKQALLFLEQLANYSVVDDVSVVALYLLLADHAAAARALSSNIHNSDEVIAFVCAHARCDGSETLQEYRAALRSRRPCGDPKLAAKIGEVARMIDLTNIDEQHLCASATELLDPLSFWKAFSLTTQQCHTS
ncbi:Hypothetical protein, putative [Bodo saltans]|uniref:Uncharacterized protein n=1 Tax=Bodo saltans TaxID=75058 RepID=A0A0S4JDI0_BODSA|nr:Hypothetical protein, putative [Bodo saltans]|eukprot:CUG88227.1 Hypothetical protein, putative [Bodo saltans]